MAVGIIIAWAGAGPMFWLLRDGVTDHQHLNAIHAFPIVFSLQNSQDCDDKAQQAQPDDLILTSGAHNKFVGIEKLDEEALSELSPDLSKKAERTEAAADHKAAQHRYETL
jgi:low affinity Fe/Cu permease